MQAANPALAGSLLQQMLAPGGAPPGMPGVPAAAGAPQPDAASVLQQMMAPGAAGLPGAPGAPGMPGAAPGLVPGAAGGLAGAAMAPPAPAKHFETELEINDFPQHARWKVGAVHRGCLWVLALVGAAALGAWLCGRRCAAGA